MSFNLETTKNLLTSSLQISVPLAINDFKKNSEKLEAFEKTSLEISSYLCTHGDEILFKSSKKGETQKGFVKLTYAIAYLCLKLLNGVSVFGNHFKAF